jgi:hypothetical protein
LISYESWTSFAIGSEEQHCSPEDLSGPSDESEQQIARGVLVNACVSSRSFIGTGWKHAAHGANAGEQEDGRKTE